MCSKDGGKIKKNEIPTNKEFQPKKNLNFYLIKLYPYISATNKASTENVIPEGQDCLLSFSMCIFAYIFTGRNEVVAKVMFLQVCVCPQGGCLRQCMRGCQAPPGQADPPDQADTPWDQADPLGPGRHPPGPGRHPPGPGRLPLDKADPTGPGRPHHPQPPPPPEADSSIRSTSGRYASYCNAFLLKI